MNENDLKKYISFTKDILKSVKENQEYSWFIEMFRKEIVNDFFNNQNKISTAQTNKFDIITEQDVRRVKAYLNFIDRKAINFGNEFYGDIKDLKLKKTLVADFKEMKVAIANNDIIEFGRRMSLQIENIYNASLSNLDVHKLIKSNKSFYSKVSFQWNAKANIYDYDFTKSFFNFDKKKGETLPVELSRISFNTKSVFLLNHFNFIVNKFNIDDIYFLRNKGSHRDKLTEKESEKLKMIFTRFDSTYSFYYKVLFEIKNKITNI